MVVGDEDVGLQWGSHSVPGSRGIESRTSVPPVGGPVIVSWAPMSIARSRMPRMPWEARRTSVGSPRPSSRTVRMTWPSVRWRRKLNLGRAGVPGDVRKRFLRDAVDDQLVLLRQRRPVIQAPLNS